MPQFSIVGLSDSAKVPQWYGEVLFGQSQIRFGSLPVKVLLCGLKSASGDLGVDAEVRRVLNKEEADTAAGAGGELARMAYAAFDETAGMSGFEVYLCAPTGAGGAAATTIITITGTATAAGTLKIWVAGVLTEVQIQNGTLQNASASLVQAKLATITRLAATAGVATNAVTLTDKSPSIRGNQLICYVDFSLAPGLTVALSGVGGAAVTSSTTVVGRYFGGGTGTETLTNLLAALYPTFHKFVAVAQNDATSLAAWETQCDAKAGPTEGRKEHHVVANSGNFSAATSIAQTTLNNARFSLKWLEISEAPPCEIAAAVAALRAASEQGSTVNKAYDGYAYRTIKPQRFPADWVTSYAEKQAALDVGVSPLETKADGKVYEIRSITTRCLNGATADYRTLDTSESYVADYANERAALVWTSEFKVANPYVRPDPATNEPDPPAGVATPSLWNKRLYAEMQQMERENILTQVTLNPPSSEYNATANRIMCVMPVVPLPHQHSIGVSTRQLNVQLAA